MILEVCVDSPEGLAAAIAGGADRIELCAALALGGLTPSPGLLQLAARASVPVFAMIRPREGSFVFTEAEAEAMAQDIRAVRASGLAGVVLGASRIDGRLDTRLLGHLLAEAKGLRTTLHRSLDLTPDPFAALDEAVALGFDRVLTSGGAPTAAEGAPVIAALRASAAGRIAVMAGGGIRPANAAALVARTGVTELHASCRLPLPPGPPGFHFQSPGATRTEATIVSALKQTLASKAEDRPRSS